MDKPSPQERIERFLRNAMTKEERNEFQHELDTNSELRKEFDLFTQIKQALGWNRQLQQLDGDLEQDGFFAKFDAKPRRRRLPWWSVAAAVLALIGAIWLWSIPSSPGWEELASVSIKDIDLEAAAGLRTLTKDDTTHLTLALAAIARRDYPEADDQLATIPQDDVAYGRAKLLLAYSALAQGNYLQARTYAQEARAVNQQLLDQQKADWLELKASIGAQTPDMQLLERLTTTATHRFSSQAQQLKEQLPK